MGFQKNVRYGCAKGNRLSKKGSCLLIIFLTLSVIMMLCTITVRIIYYGKSFMRDRLLTIQRAYQVEAVKEYALAWMQKNTVYLDSLVCPIAEKTIVTTVQFNKRWVACEGESISLILSAQGGLFHKQVVVMKDQHSIYHSSFN